MREFHGLLLACFVLLTLPSVGGAQLSSTLGVETRETLQIEAWLKEGKVGRALKAVRLRIERSRASMELEVASGENLARLVALEAVGLALKGKKDDALWQWWIAQNLDRGVLHRRYGRDYGEAAAWLDRQRLRSAGKGPPGSRARTVEGWLRNAALNEAVPPEVTTQGRWRAPLEPGIGVKRDDHRSVTVELLVDTEGHPRMPVILSNTRRPGLTYSALEAIRGWRFSPGTVDGEPKEMILSVEMTAPPRTF